MRQSLTEVLDSRSWLEKTKGNDGLVGSPSFEIVSRALSLSERACGVRSDLAG